MILFASDFCKLYKIAGKKISGTTFRVRLEQGIYPPNTECRKLSKGWVIHFDETNQEISNLKITDKS